jgi:hypothetical protein
MSAQQRVVYELKIERESLLRNAKSYALALNHAAVDPETAKTFALLEIIDPPPEKAHFRRDGPGPSCGKLA